ncbi:MAG TPA: DUF4446 family protein [Acidimicrobiia bacterium]|jgi:hypothetical protein
MTIAALAVAGVALLAAVVAWAQVVSLRRRVSAVPKDGDVIGALQDLDRDLSAIEGAIEDFGPRIDRIERFLPSTVCRTGVVAFDAFGDISGNQSRSIALLNAQGTGLVLSVLVGRSETLFFTKRVERRNGVEQLSPEEEEAVEKAMTSGR